MYAHTPRAEHALRPVRMSACLSFTVHPFSDSPCFGRLTKNYSGVVSSDEAGNGDVTS